MTCVGGGGGRYTWGKLVDVYDEDNHPKDSKDPNYDSEDDSVGVSVSLTIFVLRPEGCSHHAGEL